MHSSDEDSDWDSIPQEASRVQRRVASIRSAAPPKKSFDSPYYCQEVGPQLDLGFQWPTETLHRKGSGFIQVNSNNTSTRQKQLDKKQLTKRQKVKFAIK